MCTGRAAGIWAVDLFSTTYFGEIIIFELCKNQTFRIRCTLMNPEQFLILVTHLVSYVDYQMSPWNFSIRIKINMITHGIWPILTKAKCVILNVTDSNICTIESKNNRFINSFIRIPICYDGSCKTNRFLYNYLNPLPSLNYIYIKPKRKECALLESKTVKIQILRIRFLKNFESIFCLHCKVRWLLHNVTREGNIVR